jgi:hypothetical protein
VSARLRWLVASSLLVAALVAVLAFVAARESADRGTATGRPSPALPGQAERGDQSPTPGSIVRATPAPGETPNPRDPHSLIKWLSQDLDLPRYEQTIAGIRIGPNVLRTGSPCEQTRPEAVEFTLAEGSRVWIDPAYLPAGARLAGSEAVRCGGEFAFAMLTYELPVADNIAERIEAGEDYWSLPRGGFIDILRVAGDPAMESNIPAARWEETTVAGRRAAFGRPILDEGFGGSEVMIYHDGVLTVVRAGNLSREAVLKVAAGVMR